MDARIRSSRATTMMELLVASSVMFMVFAGVALVLIKGMAYLRSNESALDAQRGAMLALNSISREVERTNMRFVYGQDGGLCFADPFGGKEDPANGITSGFQSDPTSGTLLWQRYVGYYVDNVTHNLYRRECPYNYVFATSRTTPPPAGPDVCQPASNPPGTPPMNVTWWANQTNLQPHLISSDVAVFNVTAEDVEDSYGVKVGSVVNVTLEMGDPAKNNYNHYWFKLQTQFSPRNSD